MSASVEAETNKETALRLEKVGKFKEMLTRVEEMEKSDVIYYLDIYHDPFIKKKSTGSFTLKTMKYNGKFQQVGYILMKLYKKQVRNKKNKYGTYAHELVHGSQWERNTIVIDGFNPEAYQTLGIEIEAYRLKFFYGGLTHADGSKILNIDEINGKFVLDRGYDNLKGTSTAIPTTVSDSDLKKIHLMNVDNFTKLLFLYVPDDWKDIGRLDFRTAFMHYYKGWRRDMIDHFCRDF